MRFKGASPVDKMIFRKQYKKQIEEVAKSNITMELVEDFLKLSMEVLHDEFGFGDKRMNQFKDRLENKLECINQGLVSWKDIKGNFVMVEK